MNKIEQKIKNRVLEMSKRMVPGTIDIDHCNKLGYCIQENMRTCDNIKNLCISCLDNEKIIGGLSFLFGMDKKNGIIIYRYGQEGSYINVFEGKGIDDIMGKLEKDEVINEITERTKFIQNEREEANNLETIEAFKRYIDQSEKDDNCILVIRKNRTGEYGDLDKELIKIAKEKEQQGKKIKIIDEAEIDRKIYTLGITSLELFKKLEFETKSIKEADNRINIFVIPVKRKNIKNNNQNDKKKNDNNQNDKKKNDNNQNDKKKNHVELEENYVGILILNSIDDDVYNLNNKKDRWKNYFTEKYEGLHFIGVETLKAKK